MCCLPSKSVIFSCFGDAGGQIDDIYLDNNLNDYLMLDLHCLGTGDDLLLFLVLQLKVVRLEGGQHGSSWQVRGR